MLLPAPFLERMKNQLGGEFDSFVASYTQPSERALRVNDLKISASQFKSFSGFNLQGVPWSEGGFYFNREAGAHPYHFAGLYYIQEPSAMCVNALFDVTDNDRVLDLCSAPGGKGTALAQKMRGGGIIVLNEKVPSRAKILQENVERLGITNAVVLNESPENLEGYFQNYFTKILVDAPCSGEGMFKKEAEACANWSEQNVQTCADRQIKILRSAAKMLCGGGRLVYSTCTFSREENELVIERFLAEHGEFCLVTPDALPALRSANFSVGESGLLDNLALARLYPHKLRGEGHFFALLEKREGEKCDVSPVRCCAVKRTSDAFKAFSNEYLTDFDDNNLYCAGDAIYKLPDGMFDFVRLRLLRAGVKLGESAQGRFVPSHSLAMSLSRDKFSSSVSYTPQGVLDFLKGNVADALQSAEGYAVNGYCLVCVDGYPLGFGKCVDGVIKNHIPKALRAYNPKV